MYMAPVHVDTACLLTKKNTVALPSLTIQFVGRPGVLFFVRRSRSDGY